MALSLQYQDITSKIYSQITFKYQQIQLYCHVILIYYWHWVQRPNAGSANIPHLVMSPQNGSLS
jgi:hypothetical protein